LQHPWGLSLKVPSEKCNFHRLAQNSDPLQKQLAKISQRTQISHLDNENARNVQKHTSLLTGTIDGVNQKVVAS